MNPRPSALPVARRAIAAAAVAVASLLLAFTPWIDALDGRLLDLEWHVLRGFALRPIVDDIIIVGVDEGTLRRIEEPVGLWHEPLGKALARVAAAKPRAIGLQLLLPDRSAEGMRPGGDRVLALGLAAARANGPLVASVGIDAATRSARPIPTTFLAVLREERLGVNLLARDVDGSTRRFSLSIPTEDGSFPTLVGRLCRALQRDCRDGFLDFTLGAPFRYLPLQEVLDAPELAPLEKLLAGRIVLFGETLRGADRVTVPIAYAGWEGAGMRDTPAVVVHALALRTAMQGTAPQAASRPWAFVLVVLGASIALVRFPASGLIAPLAVAALGTLGILALRAGIVFDLGAPLVAVVLAFAASGADAFATRYELRRRT